MVDCLHRVVGDCKDCRLDYDLNHHPNNYDCKRYTPVNLRTFEIKEADDFKGKIKLKRDLPKIVNT